MTQWLKHPIEKTFIQEDNTPAGTPVDMWILAEGWSYMPTLFHACRRGPASFGVDFEVGPYSNVQKKTTRRYVVLEKVIATDFPREKYEMFRTLFNGCNSLLEEAAN